jgi:hypothetical protein
MTEGLLIRTFYSIGYGIAVSAYGTLSNDYWQLHKIAFAPASLEEFAAAATKKILFSVSSKLLDSIKTGYEVPIVNGITNLSYGIVTVPQSEKFLVLRLHNREIVFQIVFATDRNYLEKQQGIPSQLIEKAIKQITTNCGLTFLSKTNLHAQIPEPI